ncbi:hypothetical protein T439DRAFT_381267 [Meredithblackwellia eburnea MCA 4105]
MGEEREPLLNNIDNNEQEQHSADNNGPSLSIPLIANTLAALRAGKLPTSSQLSSILRSALHSPLLKVEHTIFEPEYGTGRIGVGTLTREGERVREAAGEVIQAILRIVQEKDPDDRFQEFVFACKKSKLSFRIPNPAVVPPTPNPDELEEAQESLHTIVTLFLTSPQLRSLIRDFVYLARDIFDSVLSDSGEAGEMATVVVDKFAEKLAGEESQEESPKLRKENGVPTSSRPVSPPVSQDDPSPTHAESSMPKSPPSPPTGPPHAEKSAEELRDEFIDRLRDLLRSVQQNPSYQSAIRTLLLLLKSYFRQISTSMSVEATVNTPKNVTSPQSLLISVLEPFTGGSGSIDPFIKAAHTVHQYFKDENRVTVLFNDLDSFVSRALLQPDFLSSAAAHRQASDLHASVQNLARDNPQFRSDIASFFAEGTALLENIFKDRALHKLVNALEKLATAIQGWIESATLVVVGQKGVWGDLIEWVVPRIGSMLRELPLPRIEFASDSVDVAVDAPPFLATSFIPDSIRFDTNTSLVVVPFSSENPNTFTTNSTLTFQGLRMSTDNIGYWMRYKSPFLCCGPIIESGLLDIHFGTEKVGGGVGASIDFSTTTTPPLSEEEDAKRKMLFEVSQSKFKIESFDVRPHASSHPILTWFIRPLLRGILRSQVEALLQDQVTTLLHWVSRVGWEVQARGRGLGWRGLFNAMVDVAVNGLGDDDEQEEDPDAVRAAAQEHAEEQSTTVHISSKGVTIDLEAGVVGVGEEGIVLPDGEAETPIPRPTVTEIVEEHSREAVRDGKRAAETVLDGLEQAGQAVGEFEDEVEELKEDPGWRSDVFDYQ